MTVTSISVRPTMAGGCLHGHVHEKWHRNGRMINVGVDATGFRPISESEVGRLITQG